MNKDKRNYKDTVSNETILSLEGNKPRRLDCGHREPAWLLNKGRTYCKKCALSGRYIFGK